MSENKEIAVSRIFNAPRELVWKAWSDPEMFKKWWGPKGFTCPDYDMTFEVSAKYIKSMQSADGRKSFFTGVFKEINPMDKIVYTESMSDENGNRISPASMGLSPNFPSESLVTVTFEDADGKTKVTVVDTVAEVFEGAKYGWESSFNKLEAALANS